MTPSVLVVDDERNYLVILRDLLQGAGYRVETAAEPLEGLKLASRQRFDSALVDLRMGELGGLEVMERLGRIDEHLGVVIMTAYATVETAVDSLKQGAADYVLKPFDNDELLRCVGRVVAHTRLARENERLREAVRVGGDVARELIGTSPRMLEVKRLIEQVARSDSNVLVTGETGTGKELVARAIHDASARADQPFVPLHCAALSPSLLESELFGHERGAFTGAVATKRGRFELAQGGTLFLDEIGEVPESVQVKLLRAIESRSFERVGGEVALEIDVRFVAATNRELERDVREGSFREDLFYRLNVIRITVPPLREHPEDVSPLAHHFLRRYGVRQQRPAVELEPAALDLLLAYRWPGNVRELENVIERALVITDGDRIGASSLPVDLQQGSNSADLDQLARRPLQEALDHLERELILRALEENGYVQARAAEQLGLSRSALHYKLGKHGIHGPRDS